MRAFFRLDRMKRIHAEPDEKLCPGCAASLPLTSFGPNRARPPLYLQSRCRSCTNAAKGRKDAEKRKAAKATKVSRELDRIAEEVGATPASRFVYGHLVGPDGFATRPLALLEVPRTRGRWPAKPETTDDLTAPHNWCDLLGDHAREQYQAIGARIQWIKARIGSAAFFAYQ